LFRIDRIEQYVLSEHERINERSTRLLQHDGDGLTTSELEHFTHPSFNVLGRVFELSVEPLAISIDDVDVVLLVSPIHSDEQARLCGLLVHGSIPSSNGE